MSAFYDDMAITADEMIQEFRQEAALRRPGAATGPAYDPTPGAPDDHPCNIVVLAYDLREIDGTRVLATDKKVLMAKGGLAIEPALTDKVVIGGVVHAIVDVQPLNPGGSVVMYQVQVRR